MKIGTLFDAGLVVALVLSGPVLGQAAEPGAPITERVASPTFRDVIRLHEAGLSEEFLLRKIGREKVVYRLSTDDVIACKAAGLPESIIEAMLGTGPADVETGPGEAVTPDAAAPATKEAPRPIEPPPSVEPTPVPVPVQAPPVVPPAASPVAAPPAPVVVAPPGLAARADRSWEAMVHRAPGVVLFRSPWEQGVLSFRGETLSFTDASDETRNLALPAAEIVEQFLVCPKDSDSDGACFEWGVKTATAEHRFRAAGWERSGSTKPRELFEFMQAIYPGLVTARYRAKKK